MTENELRHHLINARDEYIQTIKSEIMGPGSEFFVPDADHELISARPDSRYSVGILFPQGNQVNQDNEETLPVSPLTAVTATNFLYAGAKSSAVYEVGTNVIASPFT